MGETPRPLDTERIHDLTMKFADCIQNEIENPTHGPLGFLEIKIALVQALECVLRYQEQVTVIKTDRDPGDKGPPMVV